MFYPSIIKNLHVYKASRKLVKECYFLTKHLPEEEKFNLISQIRRAALSVKLNIAEGSSRRSEVERKRYYEIVRGSVIEIDAAIETAFDLEFFTLEQLSSLCILLNQNFSLLTGMIN